MRGLGVVLAAALLWGCDRGPEGPAGAGESAGAEPRRGAAPGTWRTDPGAPESPVVDHAVAVLHPTEGNQARGVVRFTRAGEQIRVEARVTGLPPGPHAYHVHLYGDCSSPDGKSAGTHFNFAGPSENPPADIDRITGNLGDLIPGPDGTATATANIPLAQLTGDFSIIGRSVVVHERGNDPSKPPIGDAGGRLACGVIGVGEATGPSS